MVSVYRFDFLNNPEHSNPLLSMRASHPPVGPTQFSMEVEDNGDGKLNGFDRYVFFDGHQRHALNPQEGLTLLNYYLNPETLRRQGLRGVISNDPVNFLIPAHYENLEEMGTFSRTEMHRIRRSESVWNMNGEIDAELLLGRRTFAAGENAAWSRRFSSDNPVRSFLATPGGMHISDYAFYTGDWLPFVAGDMTWDEMRIGQGLEKTLVGMTFGALSFASSPRSTWHTFSINFTSNRLGRVLENREAEARIAALSQNTSNPELNLEHNVEVVAERTAMARGNLYFGFTDPLVAVACAADMDFWRWLGQVPTRNFGPYSILGLWGRNIASSATALSEGAGLSSLPAFGNLAGGLAVAGGAFTSLYEASQIWYAFYGHLPYRSTENKVFSAASTFLGEAWILSRASSELRNITQSGALNVANLMRASAMLTESGRGFNIQFVELFRDFARNFPLAHLLTRRMIDPSLRELSMNLRQAGAQLQQAAARKDEITAIISGVAARTRFMRALNWMNPRLLNGYLNRQVLSAGKALLKAQRAVLSAAETAETAGNVGRLGRVMQGAASRLAPYNANRAVGILERFLVRNSAVRLGNALGPVRQLAANARTLITATEASATQVTTSGMVETVGAELAQVGRLAGGVIQEGGVPQVMNALESGVENALGTAARGVLHMGAQAGEGVVETALEVLPEVAPELAAEGAPLLESAGAALLEGGLTTSVATAEVATVAETVVTSATVAEAAVGAAEAITLGAAAEVGLLAGVALAAGAGIGIGICYAVGVYDEHYTPRDTWRDLCSLF